MEQPHPAVQSRTRQRGFEHHDTRKTPSSPRRTPPKGTQKVKKEPFFTFFAPLPFKISALLAIIGPPNRNIAQPGRALASGARGREFESRYSDKKKKDTAKVSFSFYGMSSKMRTHEVSSTKSPFERSEFRRFRDYAARRNP